MNKQLKFIHITKTAGTSIEDIGYRYSILWGRFHKEYGYWHEFFPNKSHSLKDKYDWFTVVRNPYTRVVSEFYWEHSKIRHRTKYTQSVDLFNRIIRDKIIHRSATGDHWSDQYKYIDNKYKIYVLKFETLQTDFQNLMNYYNLNLRLDQFSNKTRTKIFDDSYLNKETIELINNIYDKDFTYFNYKKRTI